MSTDRGSMTARHSDEALDMLFGLRLRAARKMIGLSLEELAVRMGGVVTKQAISKYEKGLIRPSREVLDLLTKALDFKPCVSNLKDGWAAFDRRGVLFETGQGLRKEPGFASLSERRKYAAKIADRTIPVSDPADIRPYPPISLEKSLATEKIGSLAMQELGLCVPDDIRFRGGKKLRAKAASMLKYKTLDYLERYQALESLLGMKIEFKNPLASRTVKTIDDVEAAAAELRRCWELGSGPVVNLLGLLEDKGIPVYETSGADGFEGFSGDYGEMPFIAISRDFPPDRVRFTAAHELGHILCGFTESSHAESLCHVFAGAFLLPKSAIEKIFMPLRRKVTLSDLAGIKEVFGISLQAIMYRAKHLGLASDRQFRSFRESVNARGWSLVEPVTYHGVERASRFKQLIHYAVASGILDLDQAATLAGYPADDIQKELGIIF